MNPIKKIVIYVVAVIGLAIGIGILSTSGRLDHRFVRKVRITNLHHWHETFIAYIEEKGTIPSSLEIAYSEIKSNRAIAVIPHVENGSIMITPRPLPEGAQFEYTLAFVQNGWWILENEGQVTDSCLFGVDQDGRVFERRYLSRDQLPKWLRRESPG